MGKVFFFFFFSLEVGSVLIINVHVRKNSHIPFSPEQTRKCEEELEFLTLGKADRDGVGYLMLLKDIPVGEEDSTIIGKEADV